MKALKIGNLVAKNPIIQGGMGIGISRSNLASSVSKWRYWSYIRCKYWI